LFFENSICLQCGSPLGFDLELQTLLTLTPDSGGLVRLDDHTSRYRRCGNQLAAQCNWLIPSNSDETLCLSCSLTSVRPNDADSSGRAAFADAESSKRRLIHQLFTLKLPVVSRRDDPERGLSFELLSARDGDVITGHESGVITLDLSESDDAHREFVRQQLGEAYRTVLGHFRHEIGHYYWPLLVEGAGLLSEFRSLFGDETQPYEDARQQHYNRSRSFDFTHEYVSEYATMHPWEDWAETFAHYLHILAGLDTAQGFGISVGDPSIEAGRGAFQGSLDLRVAPLVIDWLILTMALNGMSRSIGQGELYPFVLSPHVMKKLDFVHRAVTRIAT